MAPSQPSATPTPPRQPCYPVQCIAADYFHYKGNNPFINHKYTYIQFFLTIIYNLKQNPYYLSHSPGNGYLLQKNKFKTFVYKTTCTCTQLQYYLFYENVDVHILFSLTANWKCWCAHFVQLNRENYSHNEWTNHFYKNQPKW